MDYLILGNKIQSNVPNGEWIGFFGSYFGSILGGVITLTVFWGTVWDNKKQAEKEEKLKLFEILVADAARISETQNRLLTIPASDTKYDELIYDLNEKALEVKMRLEIAEEKGLCKGAEKVIRMLDNTMGQIKKIQDIREDIMTPLQISKEKEEKIVAELCKNGFIFHIKQVILENDK